MICSDDLMEAAEKINPSVLIYYLMSTGWTVFPTKKTYLRIFQYKNKKEKESYQVTVPIDQMLGDYKLAMYRAVEMISRKEKCSLENLIRCLLNPSADILKISIEKRGKIMEEETVVLNSVEELKAFLEKTAGNDTIVKIVVEEGEQHDTAE